MKRKSVWIIFAVTLLITLPIRIYQVMFLVDPDTGFYRNETITANILSAVLILGIAAILVLCIKNQSNQKYYRAVKNVPMTVVSTLVGLGIIFQHIFIFISEDESKKNIFMMLLGVCAGIILIMTAYNFAVGENLFEKFELLALIPSIWGCACLVKLFIDCVSSVNIAENVYNTITVSFLLLYLFTQAKIFARIENENSGRMIYVFGFPAAVMLLFTGIPGTVMIFSNINKVSAFPAELYPVNILMAVYVIVFLAEYSRMSDNIFDKSYIHLNKSV